MNVLAIAGHADDIELGIGGAIAKHAQNNDNICALLVTHSGYSSYDGTVMRKKNVASSEAQTAADILGIKKLICLNYETKCVHYDVTLIEDINRIVDQFQPNLVYTHWYGDLNQDHSAIAQATMIAARHVPRILMYRSNWYKSPYDFNDNFYVDISQHIDTKITAIKAHKSEYEKKGAKWVEFIKNENRNSGIICGVEYAEVLQVIKWLI